MKFGRISREGPDGATARLVVVEPEQGRVIDLARAGTLHAVGKRHATQASAVRLAHAQFPGSMAQALGAGDILTDVATEVIQEVMATMPHWASTTSLGCRLPILRCCATA